MILDIVRSCLKRSLERFVAAGGKRMLAGLPLAVAMMGMDMLVDKRPPGAARGVTSPATKPYRPAIGARARRTAKGVHMIESER